MQQGSATSVRRCENVVHAQVHTELTGVLGSARAIRRILAYTLYGLCFHQDHTEQRC